MEDLPKHQNILYSNYNESVYHCTRILRSMQQDRKFKKQVHIYEILVCDNIGIANQCGKYKIINKLTIVCL